MLQQLRINLDYNNLCVNAELIFITNIDYFVFKKSY